MLPSDATVLYAMSCRPSLPLLAFLLTACGTNPTPSSTAADATAAPSQPPRQAEVARRGRTVMPFSLDKTQHVFEKTAQGGVQRVTAERTSDEEQISLIRRHLQHLADRFSQGHFEAPAHIHGEDMPGLAALRDGADRLAIRYQETPRGAALHYNTSDSSLVRALHKWFDAQLSDHGQHARHG